MHTTTSEQITVSGALRSPPVKERRKRNTRERIKVQSRFGEIEVDLTKKVDFKHGLLGIPAAVSFCLVELPNVSSDQFKLLQCLDDHGLSFIVVPSQADNQLLESSDVDDVCNILEIDRDDLQVLFIVTVNEDNGNRIVSVNAKAPVFVNTADNTATQYVFQNSSYKIQHVI